MIIRNFEGLKANIADSRMEPGYLFSVWILAKIFPHPQFAFVISGVIFTVSVCLFIYRNSDNVVISFIIFITWGLYSFMVQGLRQAVAMSICLFAIESAKKRKLVRFILQVLFAWCFHKSALVFGVVYFILLWKRLCFTNKLQMIVASVLLIASSGIIVIITNTYFEGYYTATIESGGFVALALYAILIGGAFLFIQHSKSVDDGNYEVVLLGTEEQRQSETLFTALTILGFSFFMMRYTGIVIMERVSFYFQFGQIILLPAILKRFNKDSRRVANATFIILSVLLFMYRVETTGLVPFEFFF